MAAVIHVALDKCFTFNVLVGTLQDTAVSLCIRYVLPGHTVIRYNNLGSAVYAKEKLNGFEYPPGNRLAVNFIDDGEDHTRYSCTAVNGTPYRTGKLLFNLK